MTASGVTVVIPTYKGAGHLPGALESVFAQTVMPAEVIVVDDRSPDDTAEVARVLAKSAPVPVRVEVLPRNSGGPARPLNAGVRLARTKWVAVLEQDDAMPADRLERSLAALERFPDCELSFGRFELVGDPPAGERAVYDPAEQLRRLGLSADAVEPTVRLPADALFAALLRRNVGISNSNLFFSKRLWERVGGFDEGVRVLADWHFLLAAARLTPAAFVNAVTLVYHYAPISLSRGGRMDHHDRPVLFLERMWLSHPHLLGAVWWEKYWAKRTQVGKLLRAGKVWPAAEIAWALVRTGAVWHHLRHRRPMPQPAA
jgi:glycosyltransferase involved in cell wall biosynthesis